MANLKEFHEVSKVQGLLAKITCKLIENGWYEVMSFLLSIILRSDTVVTPVLNRSTRWRTVAVFRIWSLKKSSLPMMHAPSLQTLTLKTTTSLMFSHLLSSFPLHSANAVAAHCLQYTHTLYLMYPALHRHHHTSGCLFHVDILVPSIAYCISILITVITDCTT